MKLNENKANFGNLDGFQLKKKKRLLTKEIRVPPYWVFSIVDLSGWHIIALPSGAFDILAVKFVRAVPYWISVHLFL